MIYSIFDEYFNPRLVDRCNYINDENHKLREALYPFVKAYMDALANGEGWHGALDRIGEKELKKAKDTYYPLLDTALKDLFQKHMDNLKDETQ